jgi:hypothetical protein
MASAGIAASLCVRIAFEPMSVPVVCPMFSVEAAVFENAALKVKTAPFIFA